MGGGGKHCIPGEKNNMVRRSHNRATECSVVCITQDSLMTETQLKLAYGKKQSKQMKTKACGSGHSESRYSSWAITNCRIPYFKSPLLCVSFCLTPATLGLRPVSGNRVPLPHVPNTIPRTASHWPPMAIPALITVAREIEPIG